MWGRFAILQASSSALVTINNTLNVKSSLVTYGIWEDIEQTNTISIQILICIFILFYSKNILILKYTY